jgi:hypothetical protein
MTLRDRRRPAASARSPTRSAPATIASAPSSRSNVSATVTIRLWDTPRLLGGRRELVQAPVLGS